VLAAAEKRHQRVAFKLGQVDTMPYIHCSLRVGGQSNRQMNQMSGGPRPSFTPKQGQYLAFIHLYTRLHRQPPAEPDMQEYFRVSPPSVHQMVLTRNGRATSRANQEPPAALNCSLIQNTCQSYFDPSATRQNHCAAELVRFWI